MNEYVDGSIIRIIGTFPDNVDSYVYFELDGVVNQFDSDYNEIEMIVNGSNPKQCIVDIDTFGMKGDHYYHFYTRGAKKAAAKGVFRVV